MPYRKPYRKAVKKYVKRKYSPRKTTAVARYKRTYKSRLGVPSGMPNVRTANLRYCCHKTISCNDLTVGWADFRANSPYAPELTDVLGGQPMGYDQWASLFNQYVVLGSKITAYITYHNQHDTNPPMIVGIYLADDAAVPSWDWRGFVEAKKGTVRCLTPNQAKPVKVVSKYSAKKFFNVKDVKDNVDRIGAGIGSNPTDEAVWILWGNSTGLEAGAANIQLNVNVIIDYCVSFNEPKDLTRS